jgi:hypothetical protein
MIEKKSPLFERKWIYFILYIFFLFSEKILAIDATNNTEGGNITVEINIMDINDNSPTFDSAGYTFINDLFS